MKRKKEYRKQKIKQEEQQERKGTERREDKRCCWSRNTEKIRYNNMKTNK